MDQNFCFTQIPCLGCSNFRRDRVLHILAALYLVLEKGDKVRVPTRDELMAGCCQRPDLTGRTWTFLRKERDKELIMEIEHGR